MKRNLSKQERIKKSEDIKKIIKQGTCVSCYGIKWFFIPNGLSYSRFAVTLKRGYGNAVERNKVKRQVKEIFRTNKGTIKPGFDMVCLVFPRKISFQERSDQITLLIKRAGLLEKIPNS